MPLLITVFSCDECGETIGLKTNDDWREFEQTWWEGFKMQFCPKCTELPETQARRLNDSRMLPDSVKKVMLENLGFAA